MPRLASAMVGSWVMNGRQKNEKTKMVRRHWRTTRTCRATWRPSTRRCRPWVPLAGGAGRLTRSRLTITNPKLTAFNTNTHDGPNWA
jgi:hypothetical protein